MSEMSLPLVTCACLTRNRREWLPKAIECFERQTYENRELLILADGEESVTDLVPNDPRIRLMVSGWTLQVGAKRNLACEAAHGSVIVHWDDDDYSAPGRVAAQVEELARSGKAVTGYQSMKFTDGRQWWQYKGSGNFALGTSLCYRRTWWERDRFAEIQIGQDEEFSRRAGKAGQLAAQGDLDLMYATVHDRNTSRRAVDRAPFELLRGFLWRDGACVAA